MARVLPQGSRLSADLQVAQGVTQPQSVRGATVEGEKLSADLQGIMSGGAKIAQTYQETNKTANVNFAQKSADESKVNLYKDLAVLDENTTPDTDLRLKKDAQEALYQHYGNKIFDNEDAQDRFDKQYHNPVSVNIANRGAVLEQEANLQDHDKIVTDTTDNYRLLITGGEKITKETLDSGVSAQTAGGYTTKGEAQENFAKESTLGLEDRAMNDLPTMLKSAGWTPETGVTRGVMNNVFNDTFSAFATMQEDGSIKWHDDIESGARVEILQEWKSFKNNVQPKNSVDPFTRTKKATTTAVSSAKNGYMPSASIEQNIKTAKKEITDIKDSKSYTDTQLDSAKVAVEELEVQLTISKTVETDVANADIDVDTVRGYLENGKPINVTRPNGSTYNDTIPASKYKAYLKTKTDDMSDTLMNTEVTPENQGKFNAQMAEVKRLEQLNNGEKSAFSIKYDEMFSQDTLSNVSDRKSLTQALAYHNFKAKTNKNWEYNKKIRVQLQDLLAKTIDGKPLTPKQLKASVDSVMEAEKNTKRSKTANKVLNDEANTAIDEVSTGDGLFWTANNATISPSVNSAVVKYLDANGLDKDVDGNVKDMEWIDYGNNIGFGKDARFPNIVGIDTEVTKMAIDQVRFAWNDANGTDFDREDITFETRFDESSNNFVVEIYNKKNSNQKLGEINSSNVEIVANKGVNDSIWRTEAYKRAMRKKNRILELANKSPKGTTPTDTGKDRIKNIAKSKQEKKEKPASATDKVNELDTSLENLNTSDMSKGEIEELQTIIGSDVDGAVGKKTKRALKYYPENEKLALEFPQFEARDINKLVEAESSNSGYGALNTRSNAYGRYQFIPDTAYNYAVKAGYKGAKPTKEKGEVTTLPAELKEFMTRENQNKMFVEFTKDNMKTIRSGEMKLPVTTFTLYAAHQQGATGAKEILTKEAKDLSDSRVSNMTDNIGLSKEEASNVMTAYKEADSKTKAEIAEDIRNIWLELYSEKMA